MEYLLALLVLTAALAYVAGEIRAVKDQVQTLANELQHQRARHDQKMLEARIAESYHEII